MTTVLLSVWADTLCGIRMGAHSGASTSRSVHPASPVLLTKNGPLRTFHSRIKVYAGRPGRLVLLTHLKFENRSRTFRPRNL